MLMIFADNMKFERDREIVKQENESNSESLQTVDSIWSNAREKINRPNNGKLGGREKFYTKDRMTD